MKKLPLLLCLLFAWGFSHGQTFYLGNDLSYVNQMEDCGAVFKEKGQPKDVYQIFADQGTNLVRVRLWVDPIWQNSLQQPVGVLPQYSDFADAKEAIGRAKAAGMQVMLDLHYSDIWADPGRQLIPARWLGVANNLEGLKDSVYQYTVRVLSNLNNAGLMPDLVKVGNENNGGILRHTGLNADYTATGSVTTSWARHGQLYNAAIRAVRDVGATATVNPKIALHYSNLTGLRNWYQTLFNNGVTDFDIIGFSYYYSWHGASIAQMGQTTRELKAAFPRYEVMVAETGYLWTTQNFDQLGNIINTPDPAYLPVIPEKQLEYQVDYTREVKRSGGSGVIFWEPAWVSTPCRTPWGRGSSQEHVAFFDPVNTNFMENGGGKWTNPHFYEDPTTRKVTFKVKATGQDVSKGVFITGDFTGSPQKALPMTHEGNGIYSSFTYLPTGAEGRYSFLLDTARLQHEQVPPACGLASGTHRTYTIPGQDVTYAFTWGTCNPIDNTTPAKVNATFKVNMAGQNTANGVYITGAMTGTNWQIIRMTAEGNNIYSYTFSLVPGDSGAYYFKNANNWNADTREVVPAACTTWYNSDRGYKTPDHDIVFAFDWGSCQAIPGMVTATAGAKNPAPEITIYPNPTGTGFLGLRTEIPQQKLCVAILNLLGQPVLPLHRIQTDASGGYAVDISRLQAGIYLVRVYQGRQVFTKRFVVE